MTMLAVVTVTRVAGTDVQVHARAVIATPARDAPAAARMAMPPSARATTRPMIAVRLLDIGFDASRHRQAGRRWGRMALATPNIAAPAIVMTDRMRFMGAPFSDQFVMMIER